MSTKQFVTLARSKALKLKISQFQVITLLLEDAFHKQIMQIVLKVPT